MNRNGAEQCIELGSIERGDTETNARGFQWRPRNEDCIVSRSKLWMSFPFDAALYEAAPQFAPNLFRFVALTETQ